MDLIDEIEGAIGIIGDFGILISSKKIAKLCEIARIAESALKEISSGKGGYGDSTNGKYIEFDLDNEMTRDELRNIAWSALKQLREE